MERLKVLFFLPPKVDASAINHELATRLALSMEAEAEIDQHMSLQGLDAKALAKYDIIHVFGCWNTAALQLLERAYTHHIPTVYTLLGGLQPWILKQHRASFGMAEQKKAIQKVSAVHLCSKLEADNFEKLKWNPRTLLVRNAVVTNSVTFDDMGSAMLGLYRKVLDSNARLLLTPESCQAIGHLVQLGIDKDVLLDKPHCHELKETLMQLSETDWRRIMIYAHDEQIEEIIKKGLTRIQFSEPNLVIQDISRFASGHHYAEGHLSGESLCFRSGSITAKMADSIKDKEVTERMVCTQLLNLKHEIDSHAAPLLHLADVYQTLRFRDMDEDRMKEIVSDLGIDDFAQRLMTVMRHVLRLSEGFMPFAPKEGMQQKALETAITKFNTWP